MTMSMDIFFVFLNDGIIWRLVILIGNFILAFSLDDHCAVRAQIFHHGHKANGLAKQCRNVCMSLL